MTSHTKKTKSTTPKKSNPEALKEEKAWSIRGVSSEAKRWAIKRAGQENKFIGAYITDLIMMDAPNHKQSKEIARQEDNVTVQEAFAKRQDEIDARLKELEAKLNKKKWFGLRGW